MRKIAELEQFIKEHETLELEAHFAQLKQKGISEFRDVFDKIKVSFINSQDIDYLNVVSMLFYEFRIHSAAPIIVAKLLSGEFDDCGGTLIYSLLALRKGTLKEELIPIWSKNISYEMQQMLEMLGVPKQI